MFGLETIRDALINFSAGTPSGQAYLAQQREAAQQAQLFPLQLQMAQAQAAKAQQDIETQGLKSKALAGVLSRIGGGGQQQPQVSPQLSQQDLTTLSLVDPDTAQSIIRAAQETRLQQEAALGKPAVYAIDTNTGNRIMLQPPTQGIQNFFGGAPTQTGQIAQALGNMQGRPPVAQEPLAPLPSPTGGYSPANSAAVDAGFAAMEAASMPNTGGVAPVAQVPDAPLPTALTAGATTTNPKAAQVGLEKQAAEPSIYYDNALKELSAWKGKNPYLPTSITNANTLLDLAVTTPTGGTESFVAPLRSIAADLGISDAVKGATGQQTFNAITSNLALPEAKQLAPVTDGDFSRLKGTFGNINNTAAANVALAAMASERARFLGALTTAKEAYVNAIGDFNIPREQRPSEQQFLKAWFKENYQPNPALGALTDLITNGTDIKVMAGTEQTGGKPFISAYSVKDKQRFALPIDMLKAQDE